MKRLVLGFVLGALLAAGSAFAYGELSESFYVSATATIFDYNRGEYLDGDCDISGDVVVSFVGSVADIDVQVHDVSCEVL